MWKPQKAFRYIWRINAVFILVAAGAITVAVVSFVLDDLNRRVVLNRGAASGVPVAEPGVGKDSSSPLVLERATSVKGTNIMCADLILRREGGKGFSSGGASETHNVLFIEPGEKSGRWLLPDNDHVISDSDVILDERDSTAERTLATAVLVKPADNSDDALGRLMLYSPSGKMVVEVANNVKQVHLASFSDGELRILYERNRRFVLAEFEPNSLAKKSEQEIDVPLLK